MGKIRRAIAELVRAMRIDYQHHPRFQAGYVAGLVDAKQHSWLDAKPVKPLLATRFKLSFDSKGRCLTFRKDQAEKLFGEWVWLIEAADGRNDPLFTRPPSRPLDRETEQKLREALRFAASRSVLSSEQELRILAALSPAGPNNV